MGGGGRKNLNSSSTSSQHFCALSCFRLFSQITCIFSPQPPLPCSVNLFSPFTAGLGYSLRRQTHSVSLLLRVTEKTERKKRNGEKERQRGREGKEGWGGGRKKWKRQKKKKKRRASPQLCRRNEKRGVNKRGKRERRGKKKSLESTSHSERCSATGSSILSDLRSTYFPSLFSPLRPSLPSTLPLPPSFPAFLFHYL